METRGVFLNKCKIKYKCNFGFGGRNKVKRACRSLKEPFQKRAVTALFCLYRLHFASLFWVHISYKFFCHFKQYFTFRVIAANKLSSLQTELFQLKMLWQNSKDIFPGKLIQGLTCPKMYQQTTTVTSWPLYSIYLSSIPLKKQKQIITLLHSVKQYTICLSDHY